MRKGMMFLLVGVLLLSFVLFFTGGKKEEEAPRAPMEISEFGDYSGITVECKLIGGAMYEPLYERIPIWEEQTGAEVVILSKKNHFDIDREMKQDIAAGTVSWDIGTNHSSFAPSYRDTFLDFKDYLSEDDFGPFLARALDNCTVKGKLVQIPRHGDVSNLYYIESLFEDANNKRKFKAQYGYELKPPETYD